MYDDTKLIQGLEELGILYSEQQLSQLHKYYEMMVKKNEVMNLTAITEYPEVVEKHWLDSLCFAKAYKMTKLPSCARLLDVGTGAGFPGIPVKIFFPEIECVLLDSLNKRIVFLQDVVDTLGLQGISCIHGRAEELARNKEYRESFDICVSRAVARLASLSELCIPFVKTGGCFFSYKSVESDAEIQEASKAIQEMNGTLETVLQYNIPTSDLVRKIVVVRKKGDTKEKYPRGGGKPLKAPLV